MEKHNTSTPSTIPTIPSHTITNYKYEEMKQIYETVKGGIIDIAAMEDAGITDMKNFIYNNAKNGDILRVRVDVEDTRSRNNNNNNPMSPSPRVLEAMFLQSGAFIPHLQQHLFLPFDENNGVMQNISVADSTISFQGNVITVDDEKIGFGEPFFLGGRRVVLVRGSVVLIIEDSLVSDFPLPGAEAEILQNEGTMALGDIVTTGYVGNGVGVVQIGSKKSNEEITSIDSYIFAHDTITDQRTCILKKSHQLQDDSTQVLASGKIGLWYGDAIFEDVLQYSPKSVTIKSVDPETNEEARTTLDVDGMSFSSDNSAVVMGQFRIKYDEDSDSVQIQHLDSLTGEYNTKREFAR